MCVEQICENILDGHILLQLLSVCIEWMTGRWWNLVMSVSLLSCFIFYFLSVIDIIPRKKKTKMLCPNGKLKWLLERVALYFSWCLCLCVTWIVTNNNTLGRDESWLNSILMKNSKSFFIFCQFSTTQFYNSIYMCQNIYWVLCWKLTKNEETFAVFH